MESNTLIIAHRGFSSKYPECTELAFRKAMELPIDFIEVDVMRSKDGRFMVFHAADLDRISGSKGKIRDFTSAELEKIDVSGVHGAEIGFWGIPHLEDILYIAQKSDVRVCIELKDFDHGDIPGYEDLFLPILRASDMTERVVLNVNNYRFVADCRRKHPQMPLAVDFKGKVGAYGNVQKFITSTLVAGAGIVQFDYRIMRPEVVRELKCNGLAVWAWTLNEESEMVKAIQWGADAILTDDPQKLCRLLERNK